MIEIHDGTEIDYLSNCIKQLIEMERILDLDMKVKIKSHVDKINRILESAIKKERVKILESEIEKIKRGSL